MGKEKTGMHPNAKDLNGMVFGSLTVIREDNISKYRFNQMFEELTDEKGEFKFSKELLNQYTIVE